MMLSIKDAKRRIMMSLAKNRNILFFKYLIMKHMQRRDKKIYAALHIL